MSVSSEFTSQWFLAFIFELICVSFTSRKAKFTRWSRLIAKYLCHRLLFPVPSLRLAFSHVPNFFSLLHPFVSCLQSQLLGNAPHSHMHINICLKTQFSSRFRDCKLKDVESVRIGRIALFVFVWVQPLRGNTWNGSRGPRTEIKCTVGGPRGSSYKPVGDIDLACPWLVSTTGSVLSDIHITSFPSCVDRSLLPSTSGPAGWARVTWPLRDEGWAGKWLPITVLTIMSWKPKHFPFDGIFLSLPQGPSGTSGYPGSMGPPGMPVCSS